MTSLITPLSATAPVDEDPLGIFSSRLGGAASTVAIIAASVLVSYPSRVIVGLVHDVLNIGHFNHADD